MKLIRSLKKCMVQVMIYGIDKIGDNQALKFYMETISNEYVLENDDLLKESINMTLDIVFNPLMKDGMFKEEFLEVEKNNLRRVINAKIDDKGFYALNRCIEDMYGNNGFGLYKYGYLEDLEKITNKKLSDYYKKLVNEAKIDIYLSGNFDEENVKNLIIQNENIKKLKPRKENIIINNPYTENKQKVEKPKKVEEKMNINQGKLVIGLDVLLKKEDMQNAGNVYNTLLGDGANSMLFQNVREKAGLAYTARSSYNRMKNNIFIRCGIEIENYDKAVKIIKEQLDNLKNGNFSEQDIQDAKMYIISGIKSIETEQDSEMVFYIGQEISKIKNSVKKYIEDIEKVTKEEIIEVANNIQINTIYFLTGEIEKNSNEMEDD